MNKYILWTVYALFVYYCIQNHLLGIHIPFKIAANVFIVYTIMIMSYNLYRL